MPSFGFYQELFGNRELLGAVHWPNSEHAEQCGSDHTRCLEPPAAPQELMPVHTCSTEIYGELVTQKWSCLNWEQHFRKEKALVSFISSGVWLGWCGGLPSRRCWVL